MSICSQFLEFIEYLLFYCLYFCSLSCFIVIVSLSTLVEFRGDSQGLIMVHMAPKSFCCILKWKFCIVKYIRQYNIFIVFTVYIVTVLRYCLNFNVSLSTLLSVFSVDSFIVSFSTLVSFLMVVPFYCFIIYTSIS